jgi:predicted O-linked N-acetylglucosamine transferase (SPINDLY family)
MAVRSISSLGLPRRTAGTRIRLAIVINQIRQHSVWDIVLRGLLFHIDRTCFEVVLYHTGSAKDAETVAARALVDVWRESDQFTEFDSLLGKLREDAPDVLFYPEIGMDPIAFRLAAHRLAPLQMAAWGHPVTTGLSSIDLYLSGGLLKSDQAVAHYREKLIRLPGTGCCAMPPDIAEEPIPDVAILLSERPGPRFVIAQRAFKADPTHDFLYAKIALATGECSLILPEDPVYPWASAVVYERLETAFSTQHGLDPSRYLVKIPWLSAGGFRSLLELCDVFLDCPAFSGYTTAWQAICAGLPIVTLEGEFLRQRLAAGLLRKIGVTEMIAADSHEYVAIAANLAHEAKNSERRQARRAALSKAAHRAANDRAVVRAFERVIIEELARRKSVRLDDILTVRS